MRSPHFTTITMRYVFFLTNILGIPLILQMQKLQNVHGADFSSRNQIGPPLPLRNICDFSVISKVWKIKENGDTSNYLSLFYKRDFCKSTLFNPETFDVFESFCNPKCMVFGKTRHFSRYDYILEILHFNCVFFCWKHQTI